MNELTTQIPLELLTSGNEQEQNSKVPIGWGIFNELKIKEYLKDERYFKTNFQVEIDKSLDFVENKSSFYAEFVSFMKDPNKVIEFRKKLSEKMGSSTHDIYELRQAMAALLDESKILPKVYTKNYYSESEKASINTAAMNQVIEILKCQLIPDNNSAYRSVPREYAGKVRSDGVSSNWGFEKEGILIADRYRKNGDIMIKSTIADLRKVGIIVNDFHAVNGNAVKLIHTVSSPVKFAEFS